MAGPVYDEKKGEKGAKEKEKEKDRERATGADRVYDLVSSQK